MARDSRALRLQCLDPGAQIFVEIDFRNRHNLRRGIRLCAQFVGAHGRQRRYDRRLRPLFRHLVRRCRGTSRPS